MNGWMCISLQGTADMFVFLFFGGARHSDKQLVVSSRRRKTKKQIMEDVARAINIAPLRGFQMVSGSATDATRGKMWVKGFNLCAADLDRQCGAFPSRRIGI